MKTIFYQEDHHHKFLQNYNSAQLQKFLDPMILSIIFKFLQHLSICCLKNPICSGSFNTYLQLKFTFSEKATKIDKNLHSQFDSTYVVTVKSTVKILSILVAFLKTMNFTSYMKIWKGVLVTFDALIIKPNTVVFYYCLWFDFYCIRR